MSVARKWGPWFVLVAVAVAMLTVGVQRGGGRPSLDAEVQHLSSQVRCPVCHGETVAESQAAPSVEIRNEIRADLVRGEKPDQILGSIVAVYGPGILEKPQAKGISLLVWVVPVVAFVTAAVGLILALRRWRRPVAGEVALGAATGQAVVREHAGVAATEQAVVQEHAAVAAPEQAVAEPAAPLSVAAPPRRSRAKLVAGVAGVVLIAGSASWAVAASSGTRLPGQEITGQALGSQAVAQHLQNATKDAERNDIVGAVKEYQQVLASDPRQVQALTGEGWLLAETGQPGLLKQGLALLAKAEQIQPGYAPAHVYRGIALLSEADYGDSVPELQWYLDHDPDPQLVAQVRTALSRAKAGAAAEAAGSPAPAAGSASR